jgi:hypothetical protein
MRTVLRVVRTTAKYWVLVGIIIIGLEFLIAATIQQFIRQSANDPQVQMAKDTAASLAAGQSIQNVVSANKVDIATSLASYVVVFDVNGKPIASSGQLNGQMPTIPSGVFDSVRQSGEDRITWQPQTGVRSAVVVTQFKGQTSGFVLAGRSLRESERLQDNITQLLSAGLIGLLVIILPITVFLFRRAV